MTDEMCGVLVNGRPLEDYRGAALLNYSVSGSAINASTFRGLNRSNFDVLRETYGLRQIKLTVVFDGENLNAAKMNKSTFDGALWGKVELYISAEGFFYTCIIDSIGGDELVGIGDENAKIKATYTLSGFRRAAMVSARVPSRGVINCLSTVPFTDCRLTATVSAPFAEYTLGGATWPDVVAGDQLVFDGINGRITKNGVNVAASVDWIDFPRLLPGENRNDAFDEVLVEYFPTYL